MKPEKRCRITEKNRIGIKNSFYGKTHTDEVKKIMSEKRKLRTGYYHSDETKQKMSNSAMGMNDWAKGRVWCYDPNTKESKMVVSKNEIPNNWIMGRPFKKRNRKKCHQNSHV